MKTSQNPKGSTPQIGFAIQTGDFLSQLWHRNHYLGEETAHISWGYLVTLKGTLRWGGFMASRGWLEILGRLWLVNKMAGDTEGWKLGIGGDSDVM